jgi:hypothetical protein
MTGSESDAHGHRWWHSALSAGIGAAAVIVAAVIGKATNTINVITGPTPTATVSAVRTVTVTTTRTVTSTPTSRASSSQAAPAVPPVRRHGLLVLRRATTQYVDLDSTSTNPSWDESLGDGSLDGPSGGDGVDVYNSAKIALLHDPEQATYGTCLLHEQQQLWDNNTIPIGQLGNGSHLCIETTAGRLALLTVVGEATPTLLTFDVTVWQKP